MLEGVLPINCACESTNETHYFHLEHYFNSSSCCELLLVEKRWIVDIVKNTLLIFLPQKLPQCAFEMILMHKFDSTMSPLTARVLGSPICHQKWAKNENIQLKLENE